MASSSLPVNTGVIFPSTGVDMDINFEALYDVLLKECENVFPSIIDKLNKEKIYSIALYNDGGEWKSLYPTLSTYDGLNSVISEYRKDDYYSDQSDEELFKDLKWSPCDSPMLEDYFGTLPESQVLLDSIAEVMSKLFDEDKEDEYEKLEDEIIKVCLKVLQSLDEKGVFNKLERSSFVLNLLTGDQSDEERLESALLINPKPVFDRYALEI